MSAPTYYGLVVDLLWGSYRETGAMDLGLYRDMLLTINQSINQYSITVTG